MSGLTRATAGQSTPQPSLSNRVGAPKVPVPTLQQIAEHCDRNNIQLAQTIRSLLNLCTSLGIEVPMDSFIAAESEKDPSDPGTLYAICETAVRQSQFIAAAEAVVEALHAHLGA